MLLISFVVLLVFVFFSTRVFIHGHWWLTGQQGKKRDHVLFHSNTPTHSRTFRHLFGTLHLKWLSYVSNRNACFSSRMLATRWDFTIFSNYHLIDWWCEVCFSLFTWWFDTRFLIQQSWYGKPADLNSHRLSPLYYKQTD